MPGTLEPENFKFSICPVNFNKSNVCLNNFVFDFRQSLRDATLEDLTMGPVIAEMVMRHIPLWGIWDNVVKYSGFGKS